MLLASIMIIINNYIIIIIIMGGSVEIYSILYHSATEFSNLIGQTVLIKESPVSVSEVKL